MRPIIPLAMTPRVINSDWIDEADNERSRVSGQGNSPQVRRGHTARFPLLFGGGRGRGRARAGRQGLGGKSPDTRGRPGQGRRRQGGEVARGGATVSAENTTHGAAPC